MVVEILKPLPLGGLSLLCMAIHLLISTQSWVIWAWKHYPITINSALVQGHLQVKQVLSADFVVSSMLFTQTSRSLEPITSNGYGSGMLRAEKEQKKHGPSLHSMTRIRNHKKMWPSKSREGLTWVINPGLDDVIQCEAAGGFLVPQACIQLRGKHLGHVVVVLAEVGVLLLRRVVHLQLVVGVAERHGCSELREKSHSLDASQTKWCARASKDEASLPLQPH